MASISSSYLSGLTRNPAITIPIPNPNRRRRCLITSSSSPPQCRSSSATVCLRRSLSIGLVLLNSFAIANRVDAASPFDKYVKRKKLDPLEAYVPAVLLSEDQFKDLGTNSKYFCKLMQETSQFVILCFFGEMIDKKSEKFLDVEQPRYDISRSLLRSGPAASLRVNIRAVAQYATDDGNGKVASDAVDRCLRALEDLDSLLLNATRNDPRASVGSMKSKIGIALSALDSLLQTVPTAVLNKGKAVADAYRNPSIVEEERRPLDLDPDLKQLEAIL